MFLRPLCKVTTLSILIAMFGVSSALCSAQSTTTLSNTSSAMATTDTNWSTNLTVPQFNSSQGTLQSVQVTLNWNSYQSATATNNDVSTDQVYVNETVSISATLPNSTTITDGPPNMVIGTSVNEGGFIIPTYNLGAGQTATAGPTTSSGTISSATYTDATTLSTFTGSGSVSFPVSGAGYVYEAGSGGNDAFTAVTQAGATVTVTYTYQAGILNTLSCIEGEVFNNKCGNGICGNTGEGGLCGGIKINICDALGNLIQTVVTAADGTFCCQGLKPYCTYQCCLNTATLPSGYCLSNGLCTLLTNTPLTGCSLSLNFPAVCPNNSGCFTSCCQTDWCSSPLLCLLKLDCLDLHYCQVFPSNTCLELGGPNACCLFNSASSLLKFFCQSGSCCPLPLGCLLDTPCNTLGTLSGELCACQLNCDFSDAGCFRSGFKNLVCQTGKFKGCTVKQICNASQCYLNGSACLPCVPKCSPTDLCTCLHSINTCYGPSGNSAGNGFCH